MHLNYPHDAKITEFLCILGYLLKKPVSITKTEILGYSFGSESIVKHGQKLWII